MPTKGPTVTQRTSKHDRALESYPKLNRYNTFDDFRLHFDGKTQAASYSIAQAPVDILYAPSPGSRRLAIFFNSQQKAGSLRLFTWQKVSRSFEANRLFIADPTVSENEHLNLGWYLGRQGLNLQMHITELITHIRERSGAEEVIFFGSSGGGYPAIYHSQVFPSSLAVTLAPTTTVRYHSNAKLVDAWMNAAWGVGRQHIDKVPSEYTLDLPSRLPSTLSNPILILQNNKDEDFIESQSRPLIESRNGGTVESAVDLPNLHLRLEPYGQGHMPPPPDRISRLASRISGIPCGGLADADYSTILDETASTGQPDTD